MKKEPLLIFMLVTTTLFVASFASATEGTILISLDSSDMGAVVRVLDPDTDSRIDDGVSTKNYGTGVVEVTYETILSEVKFLVLLTKNGNVIGKKTVGPFFVANSLELDCRSGKNCAEVKVVEEEVSETSEPVATNDTNKTNETVAAPTEAAGSGEVEPATETTDETIGSETVSLTGNAVSDSGVGSSSRWYIVVGIIVVLTLFTLTGVFLHKRKRKGRMQVVTVKQSELQRKNSSAEEAELAELEKKVKENEARIRQLKSRGDTRKRIAAAKQKLVQEDDELRKLEGGPSRPSGDNKDNKLWGTK